MSLLFRKRTKTDFIPYFHSCCLIGSVWVTCSPINQSKGPESCSPVNQSKVATVGGGGWWVEFMLPYMAGQCPSCWYQGDGYQEMRNSWWVSRTTLRASHPLNIHDITSYHMPDMKVGLYLHGLSNHLDFSWFSSFHFLGGTFVFSVVSPASSFPCRGYRHICFIFCWTNYEERLDQKNFLNSIRLPTLICFTVTP